MTRAIRFGCLGLVSLITLLGCDREPPVSLPRAEPFIALERDFQGLEDWHQIDLPEREAQGVTHLAGDAVEYVNQVPRPGQKSFPVGTILVKRMTSGERKNDMFAMVKRGGGFNAAGAHGWEWFELVRREDDSIGIKWRGIDAPFGESYSQTADSSKEEGDPMGGCNGCHEMATKNDFVLTAELTLSKL
jgi:hypothetical protein